MTPEDTTRAVFLEHIAAFNAHHTGRLLAGMHDEVVWATGADVFRGRASLADLFDDWLWALHPRLGVARTVVEGDTAAAECIEHMVVDGRDDTFRIAVFLTVERGLITRAKVFREGSADITMGTE